MPIVGIVKDLPEVLDELKITANRNNVVIRTGGNSRKAKIGIGDRLVVTYDNYELVIYVRGVVDDEEEMLGMTD